jgi:hypothetical protein
MKMENPVGAEKIAFAGGDVERFKWIASSVREIVRGFEPVF